MYKNGEFIKEYSSAYTNSFRYMPHSPILIDDFIGETIAKNENMKPRQAKLVTEALNYIARHGYGNLPPRILWIAAKCLVLYGMKIGEIVDLYTKYAGDWGGVSTVYRFDAIVDGRVVKSVTKAPMSYGSLKINAYKTTLTESESYDVTAIRISAVDEYGNTLYFSGEPLKITTDGPIELIGPDIVSLKGGMTGIYLKTVGKPGSASVTISSSTLGEVTIPLEIKVD